jgi:hypothetical protein
MDQRSIVLYLARKELSAMTIHHDLVATLGPEAVGYSYVTRYLVGPYLFRPTLLPILPRQNRSLTIVIRLFSRNRRAAVCVNSRVSAADSSPTHQGASALDTIVRVLCAPSLTDFPSFVTLSKTGPPGTLTEALVRVGMTRTPIMRS